MPTRRGGEPAWLPAHLLWAPLLVPGFWLLVGRARKVATGSNEWSVQAILLAPNGWFDPLWRGLTGAALVAGGLTLWIVARWRPRPLRVPLTVARFPLFALASFLLALLAILATWHIDFASTVISGGADGLAWRFVASLRTSWLDRATGITAGLAALACYAFSYGGTARFVRRTPPSSEAAEAAKA
jgi:hypothetical protein